MNETVRICTDNDALSHEAASLFIEHAKNAIAERGRFLIAISGGSTPLRLFSLLGNDYVDQAEWKHIHVFWTDERCVPKDEEQSNFKHAYDLWLSKVPLPEANIHRIGGEHDSEHGARRYEEEIRSVFGVSGLPEFDLILLGMGEDGHTASLFPDSNSLNETSRLSIPVYVENLRSWRVTLTLPVLNSALNCIFLVSGTAKAPVLAEILESAEKRASYPAGLVKPVSGALTWLIDEEASSGLEDPSQY